MINKKRTVLTLILSVLFSANALAQSVSSTTDSPTVGTGNTYEKEVTPLLREISKKKSLLELRKLDRELEKLDEDAAKAQIDRDKAANPPPAANALPFSPQIYPNGVVPQASASLMSVDSKEVKVIMIYGYDNNLAAKLKVGNQGGYVVQKGDILPDGRTVSLVTPYYIEVQSSKAKKGTGEKIFVTGSEAPLANNVQPNLGVASSAVAPSAPPTLPLPINNQSVLKTIPSPNAK